MNVYLLSNSPSKESNCPFGVSYVSPEMLKSPRTHMKFVASDSTCIVDVMADIPLALLPVSTKTVKTVPILPVNPWNNKVVTVLAHLYPQYAANIRKTFMYGEEMFIDLIKSLDATFMWSETVKTYLGGMI